MTTHSAPAPALGPGHPRLADRPAGDLSDSTDSIILRRYDVAWLRRNGDVAFGHHSAPALPVFERCFGGFAHGALVHTPRGPVAIEDLLPGDMVDTRDHGALPILWRGSMSIQRNDTDTQPRMWRIMTDSFGFERPVCDLLAGPAAWMLHRRPWARDRGAAQPVLSQVADLADGTSVLAVAPAGSVQFYHLCLPRHAILRINGLEMDSCHPGGSLRGSTTPGVVQQLMSLFPHLAHPGDFGPLSYPRLTGDDITGAVA